MSNKMINKLGDKIRIEKNISEENLIELQNFRSSYYDSTSRIFYMLCELSKKLKNKMIVTYRIKRLESVINKLKRFEDMQLSRMWDIGGCRCIVKNDKDLNEIYEFIKSEFDVEIKKENSYLITPKANGYRALHLYVKHKNYNQTIEVQIRNESDHNWATLVEITDLLFGYNIKEMEDNKDLVRFHLYLSKLEKLDYNEKREIAKIISNYDYFNQLSNIFTRNYIQVRKQWLEIEHKQNYNYIIIKSNKMNPPEITSYPRIEDAEIYYFDEFKKNQNTNILLTHMINPTYKQISIAYSNYILTYHTFLFDCLEIVESLLVQSLQKGKYYDYIKYYLLYFGNTGNYINKLEEEVGEIENSLHKSNFKNFQITKLKEWVNDNKENIEKIKDRNKKMNNKIGKIEKNIIIKLLDKYLLNIMLNMKEKSIKNTRK